MEPVEKLTECSVLCKVSLKASDPRSPLDPHPLVVRNAARCRSPGQQHGQGWWQVFFPHRLWMGLRHNGSGTGASLSRRAFSLPRAIRRHFAKYVMMLLPRAVCVCRYPGLRHNGSGSEANLARRAILLLRAIRRHFAKMLLPRAVCRVPLFWIAA